MTLTVYLPTLFFDVFVASLSVYTAALFFEVLKKGSVVNYVNLSTVLLVCIISGVLAALFPPPRAQWQRWISFVWAVFIAGFVAVLVYRLSAPFEQWRLLFTALAGFFVFIFVLLPNSEIV